MKKYIDFLKNNIELVTGVTIILILSNFVILQMAFEKHNVFAGVFFSAIPYVIAMELMFFGIGLRKKTELTILLLKCCYLPYLLSFLYLEV